MNLLSFGLDLEGFTTEQVNRLNEFVNLFETLSKYDGKVINPVMGEGLVALNSSITETSKLLDDLDVKLSGLGKRSSTSSAAKEQTELSLAMKEYAKSADQAATYSAKLSVAQSEQAKQTLALKLQLSEVTKEMIAQASSTDSLIQKRINSIVGIQDETTNLAENNAMKMQAVNALRALANEQDAEAAAQARNSKKDAAQQKRDEAEADRQRTAALKAAVAQEELDAKAKAENDKVTKSLLTDYQLLKQAIIDQGNAYQRLYLVQGKDSPATKAALSEYAATSAIVGDIDKQLNKASSSGSGFGRVLGGMFGQLRTLAYILPGIGIAGIFNLAFEAVGNLVEKLGILEGSEYKQLQSTKQLSDAWNELTVAYEKAEDEIKKIATFDDNSYETSKRQTELLKARGHSQDEILSDEVENSKKRVELSDKELDHYYTNNINRLKLSADADAREKEAISSRIENLNEQIVTTGADSSKGKQLSAERDLEKSSLEALNISYSSKIKVIQEYYASRQDLAKAQNEFEKFNEDQQRKLTVETTKDNLQVRIEANQKILSNERSTFSERISAAKQIADAERKLNAINAFNVTSNNSSTPKEKEIALNKQIDDNKKAAIKLEDQTSKIETEFYQRRLKATTETTKAQLDEQAIANERIFKNEQNTYQERLDAYNKYIEIRQQIQDLEFQKDIQRGAKKAGGKTSLTKEESGEILTQTNAQKANIQADAQASVYNIISTALQKQLKLIDDTNKLEEQKNNDSYIKELELLNNRFDQQKISYAKYKKERQEIDRKYSISSLDAQIADDTIEINRLQDFLAKTETRLSFAKSRAEETQSKVDKNSANGITSLADNKNNEEAIGTEKALADSVIGIRLKLHDRENELQKDKLAKAKITNAELEKAQKLHAENIREIEERVFDLTKNLLDAQYDKRLEVLQRTKEVADQSYDDQEQAINRSTLSSKDKAALDIQILQQKKEYDKNADREERKLKHNQAVMDRDLAVAHIAWETEEAIMKAYAELPPLLADGIALERGIIGALSAAAILAVNIPAYATGTDFHPGGLARTGEGNKPEIIKEPYKSPYIVFKDNISYLPKGTEVIPMADSPDFTIPVKKDEAWEQMRWLAKQISKNNKKEIKNINIVKVDFRNEAWKRNILGN